MKRAFGKSISEDGPNLTQTDSKASAKKVKKPKTPNNVYKPGEVMPKQKYRGPVNKEHKEKLDAFSFGNAFRRRNSDHSQYSPMGSRLPSRRGSLFSRKSLGLGSRQPSHVDEAVMESAEADDDVTNGEGGKTLIHASELTCRSWSIQKTDTGREPAAPHPRQCYHGPAARDTNGHERHHEWACQRDGLRPAFHGGGAHTSDDTDHLEASIGRQSLSCTRLTRRTYGRRICIRNGYNVGITRVPQNWLNSCGNCAHGGFDSAKTGMWISRLGVAFGCRRFT